MTSPNASGPSIKLLISLSILIAVVVAFSIRLLTPDKLSALGSILSGAGSLLAVLWFSAGLRYQARQLEEQRKQFSAQFEKLQESSRRDALFAAREILNHAESRATALGGIDRIDELWTSYSNFKGLSGILNSSDPHEVIREFGAWSKCEGAALILLSGIRSAAEAYLPSAGISGIDYQKKPEDFYFIYKAHFESKPYFSAFAGTANLLAEFMVRFSPAREAAQIAILSASAKAFGRNLVKMDKLKEDIARHVASGYPLPEIAKNI